MTRQDIQGEAKQHSILQAAIHYIYNTFTPNEQNLLLCLAPLKFAININMLPEYRQQLRQHAVLAHLPFDDWENVLEKVADWGLLRLYPDVLLQSAFADFLRSRLGEKAESQNAIETTSTQYYNNALKIDTVTQPEMSNQNDVQMPTQNDKETSLVLSGKIKIKFCQRLGVDWQDLADYLKIPPHRRSQFRQGRECQAIWEWLEERENLNILKEALDVLDRQDLVELLNTNNK
ncbi:MAG TPA: hypothetical protein EYP59_13530 [Thiotrichaceae bacterium]|nr:hypothetical protein [Thiotrichaceae bacterium]